MKRAWEDEGQGSKPGASGWGPVYDHPYATGYNTMPSYPTIESSMSGQPSYQSYQDHADKRNRTNGTNLEDEMGDDDDDDDDDDEGDDGDDRNDNGKGTLAKGKGRGGEKPKAKLTRGSRACIPCRKIKMRCIPDDSNPGGPCKRCKSGGHECVFEESNRGKRSTRKNEALAAKLHKMEAALRSIGGALNNLDQTNLNGFSTALHTTTNDPDMIQLITSYTAPSVVPTLAVAMHRQPFPSPHGSYPYDAGGMRGEDSAHPLQPPLSPRLHSLPDNVLSPLGLLAETSLHNADATSKRHFAGVGVGATKVHRPSPLSLDSSKPMMGRNGQPMSRSSSQSRVAVSDLRGGKADPSEERGGVASTNYFKPGAASSPQVGGLDDRIPELLTMVSREEIALLFDIFFDNMAPHVPVVYKQFHTPDLVLQRSQFLCTVICAIAARFHEKREDLHTALSAYAKRLAFEVPSRGYKSVEVCQAYLLLSVWTLGPEKTFEQDRTWLMLGMAIRMATDLNLHRKSMVSGLETEEGRARDLEIINRERTWLLCFILDRSISAQMGKPYTLREDYIIRNACEASWHQQRFSLPADKALAAYVVLQQIMSRAIDSIYSSTQTVSGLRNDCDYMLIVRSAHEELRRWLTEWNKPDSLSVLDPKNDYDSRAQFYYAYSSLVLYSFGLENALERAKMDISFFLLNVYEAATRVCTAVKEEFSPKHYLPYLPDTNFVMCSYALLSLLKLLKPELKPYHDYEETIFKLVSEVADLLEECAIDPSHQPAIYAAFIREIVRKTKEAKLLPGSSRAGSPAVNGQNFDLLNTTTGSQGQMAQPPLGQIYDPTLMGDWANEPMDAPQFTFIPQGGDMMILPSAAGPSESIQNSPSASFPTHYTPQPSHLAHPGQANGTPQTAGWAEYLPTFMSSDGFDGWDGSMLLPGFGRGQITLGGGVLHSQFGSGIITPAQHSPAASRVQSRAHTPAT